MDEAHHRLSAIYRRNTSWRGEWATAPSRWAPAGWQWRQAWRGRALGARTPRRARLLPPLLASSSNGHFKNMAVGGFVRCEILLQILNFQQILTKF